MAKNQSSNGKKTSKSGVDSRINRKREKAKSFERYDRQRPLQLTFFEILEPENKQYSNTVEIYDFLPKEFLGKAPRVADTYLPRLERDFEKAVEELKESNTILNFYKEEIKQISPRIKVVDYKLSFQAHFDFISDVKKANYIKLSLKDDEDTIYSGNSNS